MIHREGDLGDRRWLRTTGPHRQAIVTLAGNIHALKERGCPLEALQVEHDTIHLVLRNLREGVRFGAGRAEIIEILNSAIQFCALHFGEEEAYLTRHSHPQLDAHAAAHKNLLAKIVAARRYASGEGLSLAVLDAIDLLHAFEEHVRTYDRVHMLPRIHGGHSERT